MAAPKRISVKFFVKNPEVVALEDFTAVLQRWIQEHSLEGLLIDVVDYKHMHEGPGIILIGEEADYGMDTRDNRLGMMLTIKRHDKESVQDLLQHSFPRILKAATLLETEPSLNGISFDFTQAKLEFLDRLQFPNTPETWEQVESVLQAFAGDAFKGAAAISRAHEDGREAFAVYIRAENEVSGEQLLANLVSPLTES